jgi:hypothetical protein
LIDIAQPPFRIYGASMTESKIASLASDQAGGLAPFDSGHGVYGQDR